ncbi:hypothetical protein F443_15469 [Phytophthora nicotianae P1569]|uniref:CCHC-type domain-containing protein n=1 Tax=Phytophthora nicotianae P1569 TaxID=1317065 RepID=V9ELG9_PHYNI|nr:hypothetical protein F443_15469 [Phytophthora nicotianae P1569]
MALPLKYTNEGVPKNWDGRDWQQYKWAMELVFKKKELADVVYEVTKRDQLTTDEGKTKFDGMQVTIMRLIGMSLPAEKLHQVRHKTTGTEMWRALCEIYECTENKTTIAHRTRYLRNELEAASLAPGKDVNEHLSKMFNLRTELTSLKYTVEDIGMVEMLLDSLPSQHEFESLKAGIRYNTGVGGASPERVRELIHAKSYPELRVEEISEAKSGKGDNQQQEKSSGSKKKQKKCFICQSTEHLIADCPHKVKPATDTEEQKRKPKGHMTIFRSNQAAARPDRAGEMVGVEAGTLSEFPETPETPIEIFDVGLDDRNDDHEVDEDSEEHRRLLRVHGRYLGVTQRTWSHSSVSIFLVLER